MKRLSTPLVLLAAVAVMAVGTAAYAAVHLARSAQLAKASTAFETLGRPGGARLLVIGDSTAEGTGASSPETSLPGLLARANPSLTVVNRGRDGARYQDFVQQIEGEKHRYDAVLVLGGGNDVIRITRAQVLRDSVQQVAQRARAVADLVILMPPGNVGNAPFFFAPWSWWMRQRSLMLHAIVQDAARAADAHYVTLFEEREDDPFAQQPRRMNAKDGLHPSDAGYALWQHELEAQALFSSSLHKGQDRPGAPRG